MSLLVPSRRGLLGGLLGLIAAPAVVKAESLMKVAAWKPPFPVAREMLPGWFECNGASLSADEYPALAAAIGAAYGGAGSNFVIPDLRGRVMTGRIQPADGAAQLVYIINARARDESNGMMPGMIAPFMRHDLSQGGRETASVMAAAIRSV